METTGIIGSLLVLLGIAFGWYALRPLVALPRLLRADVVGPSSVTSDSDFAVCQGRAESVDESLTAPFTGKRCFGVEYEITERELTPSEIPFTWTRLDDGVAAVPFELADEYGRVRIAPGSDRFGLDTESETTTVPAGDEPPEQIRSFVTARGEIAPVSDGPLSILGIGARRYTERRVDPDGSYVVAGQPEYEDGSVVFTDPVVIADRSPRAVARSRLVAAAFPLFVAVLFCVVGAGLLVVL